jgi:hypothetical protein
LSKVKKRNARKNAKKRAQKIEKMPQVEKRDAQLLGDVTSTDPSVGVSQRNVIKVVAPLSKDDLIKLSAVWPLYAVKNSIPNDLKDLADYGQVGTIYLMFVGILYDLYLAARNQVSMFTVMPRAYKELRDAILPKAVGGTSYEWNVPERCYGTGGFINQLLPYVDFASLSWYVASGALDRLYDFNVDGPIVITDEDVYNLTPQVIEAVWTNLNKRVPIDLIFPSARTGYEFCAGPFSQMIDLSYSHNLGWSGSVIEEIVPNGQYWTRFLGLVPYSDSTDTRTGIHIMNDYKGPHHYAGHLEKFNYDMLTGRTVKTLYRPKTFSFEEICTYILTMLVEADLYATDQSVSTDPKNDGAAKTVFNNMSQAQFLRYVLVLCATRFSQEGWTTFALETCEEQTTVVAGVNMTAYSDTYNIPVPRAVSEFFGSIGVKISTYRSGKGGYRLVNIPQLAVYGSTLANVLQNEAFNTTPTVETSSNLVPLLQAMSPQVVGTGPYTFNGTESALPLIFNVNTLVTATSISLSQVSGTSVPEAIQQVGDCVDAMKGNVTVSVNVANKDDVPFTVLYYTRMIEQSPMYGTMSGIYNVAYTHLTNRVNFDQRVLGSHLGVPLPISCTPLSLHQVIFSEHTVTEVNNLYPFFRVTIRSSQGFVHPKESTGDTSDFELMNRTNVAQHKGGNFLKMLSKGIKMVAPLGGKILGNFIPGAEDVVDTVSSLLPE